MLNKVRAGQGISARGWNSIIDAVVDLQNSAFLWQGGGSGITCSIKNNTGNKAKAGAVLEVTGIRNNNKSPSALRDIWLNSGFQLEGNTPSSTSTVLAYLIDGCGAGKTAECVVPGIFASYVSFPSGTASKTRASLTTKFTAGVTGNYRIIGRSNITTIDSESQAFCYLTYAPQTGHRVATLEEDLEGDDTTTVEIDGEEVEVSCPLLREGETIKEDSVVILSLNGSGEWEIIEAQCPPEDEGSGSGS